MTAKQIRNIILTISIPAFAISCILFLWQVKKFDPSIPIDAARFENFGAFISGILGTFFGGLSLVMIVFTYKITKDNINFASFDNLYKSLNDDILDNILSFIKPQ